MGNWTINIQGIGVHHNKDLPGDAQRIALACVRQLEAAGHHVDSATFTSGGADNLIQPSTLPADFYAPVYRWLKEGDVLAADDEYEKGIGIWVKAHSPVVGQPFDGKRFCQHRRKISP